MAAGGGAGDEPAAGWSQTRTITTTTKVMIVTARVIKTRRPLTVLSYTTAPLRTTTTYNTLGRPLYCPGSSPDAARNLTSCHRPRPGDVSLEAERYRHVSVAISELRVGGGIAVCPRQKGS